MRFSDRLKTPRRNRRCQAVILQALARAVAATADRSAVCWNRYRPEIGDGGDGMTIKFSPNDKGNPPGKLADAELHFSGGPLDGLKLVGFAVWERKSGGRNVTFPSRQYSVNGERRSFALLRPAADSTAQDKLRDLILEAYKEHEADLAAAV